MKSKQCSNYIDFHAYLVLQC